MGLFDGILGGVVGAGMASVVSGVIKDHGGIQGIVAQLESKGLGETVRSWVGTGPNTAITGDQLHAALGGDTLNRLAGELGITPQDLASKLAAVLPDAVDQATPDGKVPTGT